MRKPRKLTVRCLMHVLKTDKTVPIEELTSEEREYCGKEMRERLSRNMSEYYANNPEAFDLLPESYSENNFDGEERAYGQQTD